MLKTRLNSGPEITSLIGELASDNTADTLGIGGAGLLVMMTLLIWQRVKSRILQKLIFLE